MKDSRFQATYSSSFDTKVPESSNCQEIVSVMGTKHGRRVFIQLNLEPFQGQLLLGFAEEKGVKPSAVIREIAYEYIAQNVGEGIY